MEKGFVHIHSSLVSAAMRGEEEAFSRLYKLYAKAMYNTAYRIVRREDEASDILQESFISAFRNLSTYRSEASFGSWLKRIVINKAVNAVQRNRLIPFAEGEEQELPDLNDSGDSPFPFDAQQVTEAIHQLPDGYRTVLSLYLIEGYNHSEIAEILDITESTSKSQYSRSKKKLVELLYQHKL